MMGNNPIGKLREHARKLSDTSAEISEHGFSPLGLKLEAIANEIETQYMMLPIGADGVPIRPGDEVFIDSKPQTACLVEAVNGDEAVLDGMFIVTANECRHVKRDTLEDLIEDIWLDDDWHFLTDGTEYEDRIAEYADRIRKAVD